MQLGIVVSEDTQRFFDEIHQDLASHYAINTFKPRQIAAPVFKTRINRRLFYHDLDTFLSKQDVVFFEWASDLLVEATHLPHRTPIITRLHRYEMFQWSSQINWNHVDKVILVSHAMQEKFSARFPEHAHKTAVVHEGVNIHKFQPIDKPYRRDIGTLCFLSPRKRVYELILAFAELEQKEPGFHLHIGGDSSQFGDYIDALPNLVKKLGLQDRVKFYGAIHDAWNWYKNIDIFVSNSYSEGLQVAPMEAMASSRYCLSHHWDGAEELLPEENLFLTNPQFHEKVLAFDQLAATDQLRQQERMRALACQNFDMELIKSQIRSIVEEVAQGEKSAVA